jgi:hypothetical protein
MLTVKQVRPILESYADSIGRNKAGNIVLRKGFFYTHGMDGHKFAQAAIARLAARGITAQVVEVDTVWKPFKGGATVSQGSHFLAVLA